MSLYTSEVPQDLAVMSVSLAVIPGGTQKTSLESQLDLTRLSGKMRTTLSLAGNYKRWNEIF